MLDARRAHACLLYKSFVRRRRNAAWLTFFFLCACCGLKCRAHVRPGAPDAPPPPSIVQPPLRRRRTTLAAIIPPSDPECWGGGYPPNPFQLFRALCNRSIGRSKQSRQNSSPADFGKSSPGSFRGKVLQHLSNRCPWGARARSPRTPGTAF